MKNDENLEECRFNKLKHNFKDRSSFNLKEVRGLFPEVKSKTVSWFLYKMVQNKKINKVGHNEYTFLEKNNLALGFEYISEKGKKIYELLQELGYEYYISGIDALIGELLHIPETYPIIVIVEEGGIIEIKEYLEDENYSVLIEQNKAIMKEQFLKKHTDVIILSGKKFDLSYEGVANKEKAFVDLYYAVTRLDYSFSLQELYRVYESMTRKKNITNTEFIKASIDRKIRNEIEYILNFKKMPEYAKEFIKKVLMEVIIVDRNGYK